MWLAATLSLARTPAPEPPPPTQVVALPAPDPYRPVLEQWARDQGAPPEKLAEIVDELLRFDQSVAWQTGTVSLKEGTVTLVLADGDRYAPPADADRILQAWGNPPDPTTLGMLFPDHAHVMGPGVPVVVTASDDGWVDDSDARTIDYDDLLKTMRDGQDQDNADRKKAGLEGLTIDGWAEPPHYDAATHVLYWAQLLRSDGGATTLNYDVRVLGRKGVLSLNALSDQSELEHVKVAMERIRNLATFETGSTYADYKDGIDPKAAYGIAALIAGGAIAAKTGMFKGLLVLLLASKKLLVAGLAGGAAAIRGFWSRLTGAKARQEDPR